MIAGAVRERLINTLAVDRPDQIVRKLAGARAPLPVVVIDLQRAEQVLATSGPVNGWDAEIDLVAIGRDEVETLRLAERCASALHGAQWTTQGLEVRRAAVARVAEGYHEAEGLHSVTLRVALLYRQGD